MISRTSIALGLTIVTLAACAPPVEEDTAGGVSNLDKAPSGQDGKKKKEPAVVDPNDDADEQEELIEKIAEACMGHLNGMTQELIAEGNELSAPLLAQQRPLTAEEERSIAGARADAQLAMGFESKLVEPFAKWSEAKTDDALAEFAVAVPALSKEFAATFAHRQAQPRYTQRIADTVKALDKLGRLLEEHAGPEGPPPRR